MWSRNTYLIPSSHHPRATTSAFDLDGVEVLLHQHQQHHHHHHHHHPDAFSGVYLAADDAPLFNNGGLSGEPSSAAVQPKQTTATKKDRHSKIHTAQGPRDRRVRLSIGIARKFFDLQEMLGFDKPSKTLDWLLTKSKEAIQELLVQTKHKATASGCKSGSPPSECELLDFENGSADSRRKCRAAAGKEPQLQASTLARESRAKARARARERTLEKMCIKQLDGARTNGSDLNTSSSSFQCRNINELEFLQLSAAGCSSNGMKMTATSAGFPHLPLSNEDLIEESILIKRKSKNPSSLLGFQQNLVFSRDLNSNYINIPSANNANENWDVFGLTSQSNLHAILDQHRFINSNSTYS